MKQYAYKLHNGTNGTIEAEGDLSALEQLNAQFGIGTYSLQVISGGTPTVRDHKVVNQRQAGGKHADFWDRVHWRSQLYRHG